MSSVVALARHPKDYSALVEDGRGNITPYAPLEKLLKDIDIHLSNTPSRVPFSGRIIQNINAEGLMAIHTQALNEYPHMIAVKEKKGRKEKIVRCTGMFLIAFGIYMMLFGGVSKNSDAMSLGFTGGCVCVVVGGWLARAWILHPYKCMTSRKTKCEAVLSDLEAIITFATQQPSASYPLDSWSSQWRCSLLKPSKANTITATPENSEKKSQI